MGQGFEVGLLTNTVNSLTQNFYEVPAFATLAQRARIRNQLGALEPIPQFSFSEFLNVTSLYARGRSSDSADQPAGDIGVALE